MGKLNFKKAGEISSTAISTPGQNAQTLNINADDFVHNEEVLVSARNYFETGRTALYKSVACTVIWYEMSKDHTDYIAQVFSPFTVKENTDPYTTAIKATTLLDENKQASTISKYKDAMVNMMNDPQFEDRQITDFSEELLAEMVKFIRDAGGLDALSRANKTKKDKQKRLSNDEVNAIVQQYHFDDVDVIHTFDLPNNVALTASRLVTLIGVAENGKINIVDIASDDKIVEEFVRNINPVED